MPPMYYRVGDKDLFVYSHTTDSVNVLFPQSVYSRKTVLEKEKAYFIIEDIDDRLMIQTYKYHHRDKKLWIEKDSTFNLYQWLCPEWERDSLGINKKLNPTRPSGCSLSTDAHPDPADVRCRAAGLDLQSRPIEYKDFQSETIMYWTKIARVAIKQPHLRYPTDDD